MQKVVNVMQTVSAHHCYK